MIKRAIILAAGSGTRLRPLTNNIPKTLLKVGNNTILDMIISNLKTFHINDIIIVTGHASDILEAYIQRNYSNDTIRFRFVRNDKLDLGNIYSFYIAREYMDTDFILLNSDVLFHPNILEYLLNYNTSSLAIDDHKELGSEEMKVKVSNNIIKDIGKDISLKEADGEYIGIMRLNNKDANIIIKSVEELFRYGKYNLYYEDAIRVVANKYDIFYKCSTKELPCVEIDTINDLNDAYSVMNKINHDL